MSCLARLSERLHGHRITSRERNQLNQLIADNVMTTSPYLVKPNFDKVHSDDVRLFYELYDEHYFGGLLQHNLDHQSISFRLSRRMTRAGGKTTRWHQRSGPQKPRYEIAVSTTLLFQSFNDPERRVTVTGLECENRLQAMMRVMEHELVHLAEMLIWNTSSCSRRRFQSIASRLFGHTDHHHDLITPSEVAATQGIRPGSRVCFDFQGQLMEGIVNRVTKRATVLVADPNGQPYSDGHRYMKFYIPLRNLDTVE